MIREVFRLPSSFWLTLDGVIFKELVHFFHDVKSVLMKLFIIFLHCLFSRDTGDNPCFVPGICVSLFLPVLLEIY